MKIKLVCLILSTFLLVGCFEQERHFASDIHEDELGSNQNWPLIFQGTIHLQDANFDNDGFFAGGSGILESYNHGDLIINFAPASLRNKVRSFKDNDFWVWLGHPTKMDGVKQYPVVRYEVVTDSDS